jgi:hypothetical protein
MSSIWLLLNPSLLLPMISYINVNVLKQQQISTQMEDLTNSEDIGVQTNVVMV